MTHRFCLVLMFLLIGSMASAMNVKIVGVKTNDKVQVLLLKKYVDESTILRQTIRPGEKWCEATVAMTQEEFNTVIPFLKMGVEVTRIKQEVAALENPLLHKQQEPNLDHARDQLVKIIDGYSKREWIKCIKVAIALRIDAVFDAAAVVGKKKSWFKKPTKPFVEAGRR